jgi:hypothetical protein
MNPRTKAALPDAFLRLDELATYAGLAVTTLQNYLEDPVHPLPHYRFGRITTVKRSEFDTWAAQHYRVASEPLDVVRLVDAKIAGRR